MIENIAISPSIPLLVRFYSLFFFHFDNIRPFIFLF